MTLKVFITGASSGIGAALARHYAGAGATLALTARRGAVLEEVKRELTGLGGSGGNGYSGNASGVNLPGNQPQIEIYSADVTDGASMARAANDFMERYGAPDVVIACAGVSIGVDSALAEDLPVLKQVMDTNVFGTLATFQPFINAMKKQGKGALVGIASVAGNGWGFGTERPERR